MNRTASLNTTARHWLRHSLVVAAAALSAACANDEPVGPDRRPALAVAPELGVCEDLQAPAGTTLAAHLYAKGVQLYLWNGVKWAPNGVSAELFADAEGNAKVGTHSTGPIWVSLSGSQVAAVEVMKRCPHDANGVDWLLLRTEPNEVPGLFHRVRFIQRVNTVGGKEPSGGGALGEVREVPYTAEYFFYRLQ